jgi:hypothetical protein
MKNKNQENEDQNKKNKIMDPMMKLKKNIRI